MGNGAIKTVAVGCVGTPDRNYHQFLADIRRVADSRVAH
jgi:hypothetical protein